MTSKLIQELFFGQTTHYTVGVPAIVPYQGSVAGSVIQATGTVEFEDGLRTGVLLGGCWGP